MSHTPGPKEAAMRALREKEAAAAGNRSASGPTSSKPTGPTETKAKKKKGKKK